MNGYDTTHSTGLSGATIKMDGFEVGTTSSSLYLTPETHGFEGVDMQGFLYVLLDGYPPEEPEGPTLVEITSDETLTMNYEYNPNPSYSLTVDAYEIYYGTWINPGVYIDFYFAGYAPITISVTEGYHYITVDVSWGSFGLSPYDPPLCDGSNWYYNGDPIPVYADTHVTAYYDLGG